jgi:hypothetical protein
MSDLNVVALFKGEFRYIFVYDDESRDEVVAAIRDTAADPRTPFNWFDASVLTERARQQAVTVGATDDLGDEL